MKATGLMYKKAYLKILPEFCDNLAINLRIYVNNTPITIQSLIYECVPFEVQIEETYQRLLKEVTKYINK